MNYNDQILENKAFNFFKQMMYNLALSICVILLGVLIMVYGFKFELYEVLSDSQAPYFVKGDMVIVKAQDEYKVGDIVTFEQDVIGLVTHRLIAIKEVNGVKTYYCHGDNVQSADPSATTHLQDWEEDAKYVQGLIDSDIPVTDSNALNVQIVQESQMKGKVKNHIDNYGKYFNFIKGHYMLLIALVAGIWCVSSVVQNEIDIKRCRRLT